MDKCIRLYDKLSKNGQFIEKVQIGNSEAQAQNLINSVHDSKILEVYKSGVPGSLANSVGVMWQPAVYNFVLESALCSQYVVDAAYNSKVSAAIVGGGHHCERNRPLGFCTINTMAIAANYYTSNSDKSVAIVDLDAHYSNGCFDILEDKENILCTSIWNKKLDKWKAFESKNNIWHKQVFNSSEYFNAMEDLEDVIMSFSPSFIIYHLGLDALETDRLGGISGMNNELLLKRDALINRMVKRLKCPYAIFLGGVYVDYSKGEKETKVQKDEITKLQINLLKIHGL